MKSSWYAVTALVVPVLWPVALEDKISNLGIGILMVIAFNLVIFTAYATTSPQLSYFRGLDIIAASFMSGCANITLLYIVPVLFLIQLWALMYSFVAIEVHRLRVRGRQKDRGRSFDLNTASIDPPTKTATETTAGHKIASFQRGAVSRTFDYAGGAERVDDGLYRYSYDEKAASSAQPKRRRLLRRQSAVSPTSTMETTV